MTRVTAQISISLDGYVAGPDQRRDEPLGTGGERLHEWLFADELHEVDAEVRATLLAGKGAFVMGRGMFGPPEGLAAEPDWHGWWGDEPPYHVPVFVLTHVERASLEMAGGTTFHFVTGGIEAAVARAREVAGDGDVEIAGGGSTIDQALAAGLVDELTLHVVPITLGGGTRLFEGAGDLALEPVDVRHSPAVTHVRYRVG